MSVDDATKTVFLLNVFVVLLNSSMGNQLSTVSSIKTKIHMKVSNTFGRVTGILIFLKLISGPNEGIKEQKK